MVCPPKAFRSQLRRAALSCKEHGVGMYYVGFDWEPHVRCDENGTLHEFREGAIETVKCADVCYCVLVRVEQQDAYYRVTILNAFSGEIYQLNVYDGKGAYWSKPSFLSSVALRTVAA